MLRRFNELTKNTMMETLKIRFTDVTETSLTATMPVSEIIFQPAGLVHGGANIALAESVGSCASVMYIDREKYGVVGIEINANHLRGVREGTLTAVATILHKGRKTHVWEIRITDSSGKLSCICRLTNMIIDLK